MNKFNFFFLIILISNISYSQNWNLVWSDEFDGPAINTKNWVFETGGGGWGNNELQYYTSRSDNAKIENGTLVITAKQENFGGRNYTSARLNTQGLRTFKYGKIEARIKMPIEQGSWPAFWMLGANITSVGWPKCGEIDIVEHVNKTTEAVGTMHWDDNGHLSQGGITFSDVTQYHLYSIEWNSLFISWFLDGRRYYTASIANNINGTEEFHNPHFIIMNLAIGGNWPGNPDGTTKFPMMMYVDYVRAYELVTDIEEHKEMNPNQFQLNQNFPNPFNPETIIGYQVPSRNHVTLKVFDVLGNEAVTLVDEIKEAGTYNSIFNTGNSQLPSGIYFYKLNVGGVQQAKKMILLK